jgi:hypothetical protein
MHIDLISVIFTFSGKEVGYKYLKKTEREETEARQYHIKVETIPSLMRALMLHCNSNNIFVSRGICGISTEIDYVKFFCIIFHKSPSSFFRVLTYK